MYRNLFLDADGTLFDFSLAERRAFSLLAQQLGFPDTEENLELYGEVNEKCWKELEQGITTLQELKTQRFKIFLALLGIPVEGTEVSSAYETHLSRQGLLFPESKSTLETLIKRGYRLYLASNGISFVQRGRLAASSLEKYFTDIFISEEVGFQKPDPRFFAYMLQKADLQDKQEECIMIGDSESSDMQGGQNSNLDTLWIHTEETSCSLAQKPTYECKSIEEILDFFPPLIGLEHSL
ncbi:YjjG family noncanonical pyrimidine nucleotidase [uncultured Sphaerochaeta sp.]|uniref:YjjG family noncanonical pyrimidine nucleotidase n=1 Tax=uncultured Sphaerochaeta sp. TaxID=886478 RepID=UPI002A0A89E9|nr:YjjG family noncanonical pyrimidine nucleotidase [uncultured Sphaerochaeta sp.]